MSKQNSNTQFAHIESEISLRSDLASEFDKRSTGYVMGALTAFYRTMNEAGAKKEKARLEDWITGRMEESEQELKSVLEKVKALEAELSKTNVQPLVYPRPHQATIVCSHQVSFIYSDILSLLDEIGVRADALWMRRYIDKVQINQIKQEARRAITKSVDEVNKLVSSSKGRTKADTENKPVAKAPSETTESKESTVDETVSTLSPPLKTVVKKKAEPKKKVAPKKKSAPKKNVNTEKTKVIA